jgi:hypothetical protein
MKPGETQCLNPNAIVSAEDLDTALTIITEYVRSNWSTGGGRRLRHFVWSIWSGWHLISLFDLWILP